MAVDAVFVAGGLEVEEVRVDLIVGGGVVVGIIGGGVVGVIGVIIGGGGVGRVV
jgi:hypothetical protein